jgi:hypothetical protein
MSGIATELESELEFELEQELGMAQEHEHEQEAEHEAFFNHLAAMADRGGRPQALRRIALAAARSALKAKARPYPVIEGEAEWEGAAELELESTPAERANFAALMEHMGHAAAEAANEQEAAEHFLPLVGLAAKFVAPKLLGFAARKIGGRLLRRAGSHLLRRVAPRVLGRIAPRLTRGVANVARALYRNRTTRPMLQAVPRIARGTVRNLLRRVARGQPVTPQIALRQLARQTARTLSSPRALVQTHRRSAALDRTYHRRTGRFLGRPIGSMVRATPVTTVPGAIPGIVSTPVATTGLVSPVGQPMTVAAAPTVCPMCGR